MSTLHLQKWYKHKINAVWSENLLAYKGKLKILSIIN